MCSHNICIYKEVHKKYNVCDLKTTELLDCALIGVSMVIRSNRIDAHGLVRASTDPNKVSI